MSAHLARVLFACVSNSQLDCTAGHPFVPPQRVQKHARTDTWIVDIGNSGSSPFYLMLHSVEVHGICV